MPTTLLLTFHIERMSLWAYSRYVYLAISYLQYLVCSAIWLSVDTVRVVERSISEFVRPTMSPVIHRCVMKWPVCRTLIYTRLYLLFGWLSLRNGRGLNERGLVEWNWVKSWRRVCLPALRAEQLHRALHINQLFTKQKLIYVFLWHSKASSWYWGVR